MAACSFFGSLISCQPVVLKVVPFRPRAALVANFSARLVRLENAKTPSASSEVLACSLQMRQCTL